MLSTLNSREGWHRGEFQDYPARTILVLNGVFWKGVGEQLTFPAHPRTHQGRALLSDLQHVLHQADGAVVGLVSSLMMNSRSEVRAGTAAYCTAEPAGMATARASKRVREGLQGKRKLRRAAQGCPDLAALQREC